METKYQSTGSRKPVAHDLLFSLAEIVGEIDVTFGGRPPKRRTLWPFVSMFGPAQIVQGAITAQKIKLRAADVSRAAKAEHFAVLEFFRASHILRASEGSKEELKFMLRERMKVRGTV